MKRILKMSVVIMFLVLITGCYKEKTKSEVIEFIEKKHPILLEKGNSYLVAKTPIELKQRNGNVDRFWSVTAKIDDVVFEFYVVDDSVSSVWLSNNLVSCFDYVYFDIIKDKLDLKEYVNSTNPNIKMYTKENNLDIDEDFINKANLIMQYYITLEKKYKTKEELRKSIQDAKDILNQIEKLNYNFNMSYKLLYDAEEEDISNNLIREQYFSIFEKDLIEQENIDSLYDKKLDEFIEKVIDYNYINPLSLFTKEEINRVLTSDNIYKVYYSSDGTINGNLKLYKNHCGNFYGISFGTLYDILKDNNIKVVGNKKHYKFTNKNGDTYEISIKFNDLDYYETSKSVKGYYYMKNNEKQTMKYYYTTHIDTKTVQEMTGLKIVTKR